MEISSRSGVIILFVTITVSTLVLFPLLQILVERDPQLSAYDDDWNDVSEFRTSLENADNKSYNVSARPLLSSNQKSRSHGQQIWDDSWISPTDMCC